MMLSRKPFEGTSAIGAVHKPFCPRRTSPTVIVVSDVSVGYGTPQVLAMARSLSGHYGTQVLIIEPDQAERPRVLQDDDELCIERIMTMAHPYSWAGRNEYSRRVQDMLEQLQPAVLVFSSYYPLPALLNLGHRPAVTILYQVEHVGTQEFELDLVSAVIDKIDVIVFPEPNRARLDLERLRPPADTKIVLMYNCAPASSTFVPVSQRNGRIFYGGTFHKSRTNAEHFLDREVKKLPIDVYGLIQGFDDPQAVASQLAGVRGGAAFRGYIPSGRPFFDKLSQYCFSIVMWNPLDEATMYAAPNKLFDAISCGVPPFCAPHPLCVELVARFGCGVLMDDWSLAGLRDALKRALRLVGTPAYERMVANCLEARDRELNWEFQMKRLEPHLPVLREQRN